MCVCVYSDTCADRGSGLEGVSQRLGSPFVGESQRLLFDQDPFLSRLRDRLEALDQMNAQLVNDAGNIRSLHSLSLLSPIVKESTRPSEEDMQTALSQMSAHSALQTPAHAQGQAHAPARGERTIMASSRSVASSIDTHNSTSWAFTPLTKTDLRNNIDPSSNPRHSGALSAKSEKSHL